MVLCASLLASVGIFAQAPAAGDETPPEASANLTPPIEVTPPRVALAGLPAEITIHADDLPAPESRVEILGPRGEILAHGTIASRGETTLTINADASASFRVVLPEHYREAVPFTLRVIPGWISILPPALAILLALVFRQVIPALFAGIWVGAWTVYGGPGIGLMKAMDHYVAGALGDSDRIAILVFSLTLGGMVGVLSRSGGTVGLVEVLAPYATNTRRGQVVTWFMGLVIFFDDYANTLLVGNTMRPVTDKLRISREKLSYIVDSTAAPVASIALVSTWIGYEVSLIGESLKAIGSDLDPYSVFLSSLPYNFYPLLALVFGITVAVSGRDFGPMLAAERRAAQGKLHSDTASPLADFDGAALMAVPDKPHRWFNAAIPILIVLFTAFAGIWVTGRAELAASGYERSAGLVQFLGDVLGAGDSFKALLWSSLAGTLAAMALAIGQRILTLGEATAAWTTGVKSMILAVIILTLAWSISDLSMDLDTKGFLVAALSDTLDPRLLPTLVFLLASLIAFATGTSWTTMGILIPLAVPASFALAQQSGMGDAATHRILLGAVSAVLAGAIFGDHCSPISDTTVLSSTASGCDHVDHVRTQFPYAIVVAVVAVLFGYLPAGYGLSPYISLLAASAVLVAGLYWRGKVSRT